MAFDIGADHVAHGLRLVSTADGEGADWAGVVTEGLASRNNISLVSTVTNFLYPPPMAMGLTMALAINARRATSGSRT
jgi:hypothetical protein